MRRPKALSLRRPPRIPSTGDLLLVWNDTFRAKEGHGGKRTPLTAALSSDEGKSWRRVRNLETRTDAAYAYTSLIFVKDRAIMSYWEQADKRLSSRFRAVPIRWLYEPQGVDVGSSAE